jgi:hypothetical protein
MTDCNDTPFLWPSASAWLIRDGGQPREVPIEPYDAVVLTMASDRESRSGKHLNAWCMLQRAVAQIAAGTYPTIRRAVQLFAQPINPNWAIDGNLPDTTRVGRPLPAAGPHDVPCQPTRRLWDAILSGERGQGRPQLIAPEVRQGRRDNIYDMKVIIAEGRGSSSTWTRTITQTGRQAVYNILTAWSGNPIPHFDNFADYREVARQTGGNVLGPEDVLSSEGQATLARLRGASAERVGARFTEGSNVFLANTVMRPGDLIYVTCEGRDTRNPRMGIPAYGDFSNARGRVVHASGSPGTSGIAPSSPGTSGTASGNAGVAVVGSREETRWTIPSRADLQRFFGEWADREERRIGGILGPGRQA